MVFLLNILFLLLTIYIQFCYCYFTDFEIARQIDVLEAGGEVVNETRAFNFDTGYSAYKCALYN